MMNVVGEEGTSTADFVEYLKSEFLDAVYMQQNSFDKIDAAVSVERQKYVFSRVVKVLGSEFEVTEKDDARNYFNRLRQLFQDWNYTEWKSDKFNSLEAEIEQTYASKNGKIDSELDAVLKDGE